MSSNKRNVLILMLLILTSSCSKRVVGVYSVKGSFVKSDREFHFEKVLQLNKDSSFSYKESYKPKDDMMPDGILEKVPAVKFIGNGSYIVERKNLILNFSSKIRRVDTIVVSLLTANEANSWWYQIDYQRSIPTDKANIFIKMNIDGYYFGNDPMNIGYLKINGNDMPLRSVIYKEYEKAAFPIKITLSFDLLSGKNETQASGLLFPGNEKTLGYNLGYQDEVVNIPQRGNYKVEIQPARGINRIDSQVLTGKKTLPIKVVGGAIQIGELIKTKSNK